MNALHEQYRPKTWADVAGQDAAVRSVQRVLQRGWGGRAWWIVGHSGTGKTTIAKLIAAEGASEYATEEHEAGALTPAKVREIERAYSMKALPVDGKCGRAMIVNECHKLRKDTVTALLDVLERLPNHAVWIFTTTHTGQARFFADDENGDTAPLVSRCQEIRLAMGPEVYDALARRAKAVAMQAGIDGLPDAVYRTALTACNGNLRMLLQRVESGQLASEAREQLLGELRGLPLDGKHTKRRAELQAMLADMGE